jgi:L-2-hydroxyglutarate oxidase LhgO
MGIDLLVIGAGIVGLSVARAALLRYPKWSVAVVDNKKMLGDGVSGRNSGVIHGSLYYAPDSFKAQLCLRGNELTYDICEELDIPYDKCGKLIVATSKDEQESVEELYNNAVRIGARGLAFVSEQECRERYSELSCLGALHSAHSGILDPPVYLKRLLWDLENRGAMVSLTNGFEEVEDLGEQAVTLRLAKETVEARRVVNAAGLQAPEIAGQFGVQGYQSKPNKGEYYLIKKPIGIKKLIYPIPEENGLGIHLTWNTYGELYAGPSSAWAEGQEDYSFSYGAGDFVRSVARYWPAITEDDLQYGYVGLRPKVAYHGELQDDFVFHYQKENIVHLLGVESPGLTAAPAIGEKIIFAW